MIPIPHLLHNLNVRRTGIIFQGFILCKASKGRMGKISWDTAVLKIGGDLCISLYKYWYWPVYLHFTSENTNFIYLHNKQTWYIYIWNIKYNDVCCKHGTCQAGTAWWTLCILSHPFFSDFLSFSGLSWRSLTRILCYSLIPSSVSLICIQLPIFYIWYKTLFAQRNSGKLLKEKCLNVPQGVAELMQSL